MIIITHNLNPLMIVILAMVFLLICKILKVGVFYND